MMKIKKALQDERAKFRKLFAKEFKYTKKWVQSVEFKKATNSLQARLVWTEEVPFLLHGKTLMLRFCSAGRRINMEEDRIKSQCEPM